MAIIKSASDRQSKKSVKLLIAGTSGIGKTYQIKNLVEGGLKVLVIDGEGGLLSVDGVEFDSLDVREVAASTGITAWQLCRHIAVILSGVNPSVAPDDLYSTAHYNVAKSILGDALDGYDVVVFDSLSEFCRDCMVWAKQQPDAYNKHGVLDIRAVYRIIGIEVVEFMRQIQRAKPDTILISGLKEKTNADTGEVSYKILLEGSKSATELPHIFDEVVTMYFGENGERLVVTGADNPFKYPAKDRSGKLEAVEPANLFYLLNKIKGNKQQ